MKKTDLLTIVLLFLIFSLSASPNWVGVQGFGWKSDQTVTATFLGSSSTQSAIGEGVGLIIAGSFFPSQDSMFGLGYQLGATSAQEITVDGITSSVGSDEPLTWRAGATSQYRTDISDFLSLELGVGILYEIYSKTETSGGIEATMTSDTISLLATTNLLFNMTDSLSLVGGIDVCFPILATAKISSSGITAKPDVDIKGNALQAKIGIAFKL